MKIAIAGIGYVGLSLATLLSLKNEVFALDIMPEKVAKINKRISPIDDPYIVEFFSEKKLNLTATLDYEEAFKGAKYVIICTPTNYVDNMSSFDTSSVEDIIKKIVDLKIDTTIVIRSTVPVGFTESMKEKYGIKNIFFSPEFLRENNALYDNLYPSRIIVGDITKEARKFAKILKESALKKNIKTKYMSSSEAEAVKLFSNTYLALRVSFFNELDTYAEINGLNVRNIIDGVCLDKRIGDMYNNPSFGYGGYCLPKDTKQLLANYKYVPQNLIEAVINSNCTRKKHLADRIIKLNPDVVGVYRINMKKDSNNYRSSAVLDIISILKEHGLNVIIYEPTIDVNTFLGFEIVHDLKLFKEISSIIIANRVDKEIDDVKQKVYTRDLFFRD